jgi:hypothetical protein
VAAAQTQGGGRKRRDAAAPEVAVQGSTVVLVLRSLLHAVSDYAALGLLPPDERAHVLAAMAHVLQSRTAVPVSRWHRARVDGTVLMREWTVIVRTRDGLPAVLQETARALFHAAQLAAADSGSQDDDGTGMAVAWDAMVALAQAAMDAAVRVADQEALALMRILKPALAELLRAAARGHAMSAVARPLLAHALQSSSTLDVRRHRQRIPVRKRGWLTRREGGGP